MNSLNTKAYPWLRISPTEDRYIQPAYYDALLKEYFFNGKEDIEYFRDYLSTVAPDVAFLELGPGTGRATKILFESSRGVKSLTLVDLSKRMLESCKKLFVEKAAMSYIASDSIDFLLSTENIYDSIYSIWSLSHSIHKNLEDLGNENGAIKVKKAITKMTRENLRAGGSFFAIHFDSDSPEQKISLRQRRRDARDAALFADVGQQSPSKRVLDEVFEELTTSGEIVFNCERYAGEPLEFDSLEKALEYYLNFHMASYFNTSDSLDDIIKDLSADLRACEGKDAKIRTAPGCFIYTVRKLT